MNYKLIHKTAQKEHICSKVVIDGFDYYVNNEKIPNKNWFIDIKDNTLWQNEAITMSKVLFPECLLIITTNNPNIGLPQVIDKVEELATLAYPKDLHAWGINQFDDFNEKDRNVWKEGYKQSQETHPFSEDDIFSFGKFVYDYDYRIYGTKSNEELLELWKEQQTKIIYYNLIKAHYYL